MAIHRELFFRVTSPAILIGLLLFGTCLAGIWSINQLRSTRDQIVSRNVRALEAALELELRLRQLRLHTFLYVMGPIPRRQRLVAQDHREVEEAIGRVQQASNLPGEAPVVAAIEAGYQRYRASVDQPLTAPLRQASRETLLAWADEHPIRDLLVPCQRLVEMNREAMAASVAESEQVSERIRLAMILVGLVGPAGGLIAGYGIARALSRSLARLVVRVQDLNAHLDQEVDAVELKAGTSLHELDRQLDRVANRVRAIVAQAQRQQQEILRAEQLAAVGQLAAGMAHEVRNPLTSIKLLVGAALKAQPPVPLTAQDLRVIHDEVERLEHRVQTLLDFARPPESERFPCDLRTLVEEAVALVRGRARQQGINIETHLPASAVMIEADRDQLVSVLVNLFLNALDATPSGGRVTVTLEQAGGDGVSLSVADTGSGISEAVAARLFTPFTSSKPTGTGLGLSIARRVVQEHGGQLSAGNRPEGGACFTIRLPAPTGGACRVEAAGDR